MFIIYNINGSQNYIPVSALTFPRKNCSARLDFDSVLSWEFSAPLGADRCRHWRWQGKLSYLRHSNR